MKGRRLAVLALLVVSTSAWASAPCREVSGTVRTTAVACNGEGLCYTGRLRTTGPLQGMTFFRAITVQPVAGSTTLLEYTGFLEVRLRSGRVVTFASEGTVDLATGTFTEIDTSQDSEVTGTLFFEGTTNPDLTAFTGTVSGTLCGVPTPAGA